ncbi:MAG: hypothetical protein ACRYFK_14270 [Janthinobacterium lividum]
MPDYTTETRTYVGQTGTQAFDGFAGFRLGQVYELRYERRGGQVAVALVHPHGVEGLELLVSEGEFERWFRK